ncbi:MAG: asparagine synthase (glutamine-hydrolyzing) [Nanoarchaeota archaeon]
MCGIAGFYGTEDMPLLKKMTNSLVHRGPDDYGYYSDKIVGLGNRRLSIIDLSNGKQPISNENGTIWVVYNGEIYNFLKLKWELEKKGHIFKTHSDTETIVHAYEQYGENCFDLFEGMFAIALWDTSKKNLYLVRDPVGIKPLFYILQNNKLFFASEIKAILQNDEIKREVDLNAAHEFLNFRFIPFEGTLFKGIKKLLPGHFIKISENGVKIVKYWDLKVKETNYDFSYYEKNMSKLLEESVRSHLISDVPIGVYLSGGIDSSTITYYASKFSSHKIKTFCMGFNEDNDEFKHAQEMASKLNVDHRNIIISDNFLEELPKLIWYADTPKRNLYPYYIAKEASKHVKVVLSGLGSDELFAGYYHKYLYALNNDQKVILSKEQFDLLISKIKNSSDDLSFAELGQVLSSLLKQNKKADFYLLSKSLDKIFPEEYSDIYGKTLKNFTWSNLTSKYQQFFKGNNDVLTQMLKADFKVKMVDDFLFVDDVTSMANSLESRVPFLNKTLINFAFSIPHSLKINGGVGKYLLKKVMREKIGLNSINRPKQGFGPTNFETYISEVRDLAQQKLIDGVLVKKGMINQDYIKKILSSPPSPKLTRKYNLIWNMLCFEVWHNLYIDNGVYKEMNVSTTNI